MAATDFFDGRYPCSIPDLSVYNASGSDIPVGSVVSLDTGNLLGASQGAIGVVIAPAAVTTKPLGVVVEVIKATGYGRIQSVSGTCVWCIADSGGAITAGSVVGCSGAVAGAVAAYTPTDPYLGIAMTTTASTADPILVKLAIGVTA